MSEQPVSRQSYKMLRRVIIAMCILFVIIIVWGLMAMVIPILNYVDPTHVPRP